MKRTFHDVACTVCGCVCDDLSVTVEGNRVVHAERACTLAEPWLLGQGDRCPPKAMVDGEEIREEAAIRHAAKVLARSRAPLIYGLSRSSTPGQRAAVRLADRLGATIDTTASQCHAPSIMAIQQTGESTASLGEIRHRADLVIFWGVNPAVSHPRHMERYSAEPAGEFLRGGRSERTIVVVDVKPTATTELADIFLQVDPAGDFEAIWTLRALLRGVSPRAGANLGTSLEPLVDLAERMKACRCGVVFFGLGLTHGPTGHRTVQALLELVTDLNAHTRFHAKRMRVPGDVAGADSVLCWQTGFPFSVNLARGFPRYNPGEYSADEVLSRREADACLLVGSEGVAQLSAAARRHLATIPTVVLDHPADQSLIEPTIRFTTAVYGIHAAGTAYRMDEVPIPLRAILPTEYPTDEDVLQAIFKAL